MKKNWKKKRKKKNFSYMNFLRVLVYYLIN
jgi:hypothetical protein